MRQKGDEKEMKKIAEYTVKGKIDTDDTGTYRIRLQDGDFTTGFRVASFRIWPGGWATDSADCFGILSTVEDSTLNAFNPDAGENTQIAWAANGTTVSEEITSEFSLIDPDHLVVDDLHIAVRGDVGTNYMITMEKYSIDEWKAALAMARKSSAGEP